MHAIYSCTYQIASSYPSIDIDIEMKTIPFIFLFIILKLVNATTLSSKKSIDSTENIRESIMKIIGKSGMNPVTVLLSMQTSPKMATPITPKQSQSEKEKAKTFALKEAVPSPKPASTTAPVIKVGALKIDHDDLLNLIQKQDVIDKASKLMYGSFDEWMLKYGQDKPTEKINASQAIEDFKNKINGLIAEIIEVDKGKPAS